jgi:ATP-binding cassette, subfamily B, bacterial HlyB/CyaB
VQISIERLGDILNTAPEPQPLGRLAPPTPRGAIEFRNVSFRYRSSGPDVLRNVARDRPRTVPMLLHSR